MYRQWNMGTWNSGTWNEVLPDKKKIKRMQVKTRTHRLLDSEVVQLANNIIAGATGKTELASGPVTVAQLQTLTDDSVEKLNEEELADDALALTRTARQEKLRELRDGINRFAAFADSVYAGDKMQLQAVGLEVRNPALPLGLPSQPLNLRSEGGVLEGTINLVWRPVVGRPQYFAECASAADGPWTQVYTGRAAHTTCGGLTPGAEYFFRVRAHAVAGAGPWSDITKKRAS
jgi:hypothetical protein